MIMALGIALITILLLFSSQVKNKLANDAKNIDGVVGAKGSALQIALSTVWHVDIPTGNISYQNLEKIIDNKLVKKAVPIALGDSFKKYRIIGTNTDFIDFYQLKISQGQLWQNEMEVVIGFEIANQENLKIGDEFYSSHGLNLGGHEHRDQKFKIVGIFQKTNSVIDQLVVTSLKNIWQLHQTHSHQHSADEKCDHHESHDSKDFKDKEITAILLQFKNKISALPFARNINQNTNMQFASPSLEIVKLLKLIGIGSQGMKFFGFIIIALSLFSLLLAMLNSVTQRKYDLAVFRSLGASRKKLFTLIITESIIITLFASIFGLILGHVIVEIIANISSQATNIGLSGFVIVNEVLIMWFIFFTLALLISLIPAIKAYRADIKKTLIHE